VVDQQKERVLIVDDQDALRAMLARMVERAGFEPIEAKDGEEAIERFTTFAPIVVVSDITMPRMDGLALLERIKKIDRGAAVILMTGLGNEEVLLQALRGGATNFFKKPFNVSELIQEIRAVAEYRHEAARATFSTPFLEEETKRFRIPTGDDVYLPLINQVTLQLPSILPEEEILNLKVGIEEMIVNAVEHGNLGINFAEKAEAIEAGTLRELLSERLRGEGAARVVTIASRLTRERFEITIGDEGEGFDWQALPGVEAGNLLAFNGRGIFLTKIYFDEVRYNQRGNEVTLVKRRMI
jgi:DNA-binding response OmpR family regulator